jgi:hypothetical protein
MHGRSSDLLPYLNGLPENQFSVLSSQLPVLANYKRLITVHCSLFTEKLSGKSVVLNV